MAALEKELLDVREFHAARMLSEAEVEKHRIEMFVALNTEVEEKRKEVALLRKESNAAAQTLRGSGSSLSTPPCHSQGVQTEDSLLRGTTNSEGPHSVLESAQPSPSASTTQCESAVKTGIECVMVQQQQQPATQIVVLDADPGVPEGQQNWALQLEQERSRSRELQVALERCTAEVIEVVDGMESVMAEAGPLPQQSAMDPVPDYPKLLAALQSLLERKKSNTGESSV